MRTQPGAQQGSKAFHRVDVNFMKAITILIPRILACGVIDRFVVKAPLFQATVDVVFIGKNQAAYLNGLFEQWLDRGLLDICQHTDHDFPIALDHAQNRRFFTCKGAASACPFVPTATAWAVLAKDYFRRAFVSGNHIHLIAFYLTAQLGWLFFTTTPSRNWRVISCPSLPFRSSSAAICWFDRFKPIKYKHSIHVCNG